MNRLNPYSFIHVADLRLGYSQYGLDVRREDFNKAFQELVEKNVELKPDLLIIAGDALHQARPPNTTLERQHQKLQLSGRSGNPCGAGSRGQCAHS